MSGGTRSQEYQEALEYFRDELDLAAGDMSGQGDQALQALDQEIMAAGLTAGPSEGVGMASDFNELSAVEQLFIGNFFKKRLASLIRKLYSYIRRYSDRLKDCIPAVMETVQLFRQGKYVRGLIRGGQALSCILSKL